MDVIAVVLLEQQQASCYHSSASRCCLHYIYCHFYSSCRHCYLPFWAIAQHANTYIQTQTQTQAGATCANVKDARNLAVIL